MSCDYDLDDDDGDDDNYCVMRFDLHKVLSFDGIAVNVRRLDVCNGN